MPAQIEPAAWRAVDDIISDMADRRGFGFDDVEPKIRRQIRDKWRRIVVAAIRSTHEDTPSPSQTEGDTKEP